MSANSVCPNLAKMEGANVDLKDEVVSKALRLHREYLLEEKARTARVSLRWQAVSRIALLVLFAAATLQLYLMHVYATIAALPTLGVAVLH